MPRKFNANGNGPTAHNAPATAATTDKPKKVWDCYLATEAKEGEESGELLGAFEIKGGVSKAGKPYLCLSGFSKQHGPMNIFLSKNADKLIDTMVAAGYLK